MKTYFKPARLLFYFLTALVFCILGVFLAAVTDAGKNQGLAGGAIVLGYGVIAGGIAFLAAIMSVPFIKHPLVVKLNKVLGLVLLVALIVIGYRVLTKEKKQDEALPPKTPTTSMLAEVSSSAPILQQETKQPMGLGMVVPRFQEQSALYFYNVPNLNKALEDYLPYDSLVFTRTEHGFDIAYAPPWFVPAILKMDYDVLYLRALSIGHDFIQVVGNEKTGQSAWISRHDHTLLYWTDFLLTISSVDLIDPENNPLRVKPLTHAGLATGTYTYLKPLQVQSQWMQVELLDDSHRALGQAWLRWNNNGELLVRYSLFS